MQSVLQLGPACVRGPEAAVGRVGLSTKGIQESFSKMNTAKDEAFMTFHINGSEKPRTAVLLFVSALILAVAPPLSVGVMAQAAEFYIVQNVKTRKCMVVDKMPSTSTETNLVSDGIYRTRKNAEENMKQIKACEQRR